MPALHAPAANSAAANTLFRHWLPDAWLHRGWRVRLLWPVSLLYGLLVRARFKAYRLGWLTSTQLPVPVVVVGNVVVGGAGKTPTVVAIVQHLLRQGHRPGVVSRGHGRRAAHPGEPVADVLAVLPDTPAHASGDEPALICRATGVPVFVGTSRVTAGLALLAAHPDTTVLVCDDGLQHLALHADVAVAVFDERGVGNGWLLPAGLLREPWPHNHGRRVDMVLHAQPEHLATRALPCPPHVTCHQARKQLAGHAIGLDGGTCPLDQLPRQGLVALAGIAKPQAFFDMLALAQVKVDHTVPLEDHQDFSTWINSPEFQALSHLTMVCTEKDAVKFFPLLRQRRELRPDTQAWSVPLLLTPEPAFFLDLDERLSSKNGHQIA